MKVILSPLGDIYLGDIKDGLPQVIHNLEASSVVVIADEHTARYCVPVVESIMQVQVTIILPAGELSKTLDSCQHIWSGLIESGADRSSLVLNIGGGMICDLGGFAASCFQRGIRFGHIPTSLLAMVDASIGGKTGVNFEGYKNYIGHFETPSFIWIDPQFLKTLPEAEILDGMVEMVKHAVIGSRSLWDYLLKIEDTASIEWLGLIEANTLIKQHIAEADPFENGIRKTLNFGHTIGHALESHFLKTSDPISHGKAVTLGMLAEARLANHIGLLETEDFKAIIDLVRRLLRPSGVTLPSGETLQQWLRGDKKMSKGSPGYSLPDRIGSCGWDIKIEAQYVTDSLEWLSTQVEAG